MADPILLVSGSRYATAEIYGLTIARKLEPFRRHDNIALVHGGAGGVDRIARDIVERWGWRTIAVPADWDNCGEDCPQLHRVTRHRGGTYCPSAGTRRNHHMIDTWRPQAVGMLAFPAIPNQLRSGTWHAIHYAANHMPVQVVGLTLNPRVGSRA